MLCSTQVVWIYSLGTQAGKETVDRELYAQSGAHRTDPGRQKSMLPEAGALPTSEAWAEASNHMTYQKISQLSLPVCFDMW